MSSSADSYSVKAHVTLDTVTYNNIKLCDDITFDLQRDIDQQWHGRLLQFGGQAFRMDGTWQFDEHSGNGSADLRNAQLWLVPGMLGWNIAPNNLQCMLILILHIMRICSISNAC